MSEPSKRRLERGRDLVREAKEEFEMGGDKDTAKQLDKIDKEVSTKLDPQKG
jgi:hypothetical protein